MKLLQSLNEALRSLSASKLRSGLTILGIVIGVGAVIAMLGVGEGAQTTITGSISGIGTNLLFVFRGNLTEDVRNPQPLTIQDAEAMKDQFQAPSVQNVAAVIQGNGEVTFSRESTSANITGITPEYETIRNYSLIEGEFLTEEHLLGQASVALIGSQIADKLFGRREGIVGETIRIENSHSG